MRDTFEKLMAGECPTAEYKDGILLSDCGGLSLIKLVLGGDAETLAKIASEYTRPILGDTDADIPSYSKRVYNLYVCRSLIPKTAKGEAVRASLSDRRELSLMITQMLEDSAGMMLPSAFSEEFARTKYREVRLWRDGGVCAMARIAFCGKRYARINSVFTDRDRRGHGYAGALISAACSEIIERGLLPTVLADEDNGVTNRLYCSLGFDCEGRVFEYMPRGYGVCETALTCNAFSLSV